MALVAYRVRPDQTYYTGVWYPYPIKSATPPALANETLWKFLNAFGPQKPVVWNAHPPATLGSVINPGASIVAEARQIPAHQMYQSPHVGAGITAQVIQSATTNQTWLPQTTAMYAQEQAAASGTFFDQVRARQRELLYRRR